MNDVMEMVTRDAEAIRARRKKARGECPECAALADQLRRDFGVIKIHRMESLISGKVWGCDPYKDETFVPGREIIAAANFQERRKKR